MGSRNLFIYTDILWRSNSRSPISFEFMYVLVPQNKYLFVCLFWELSGKNIWFLFFPFIEIVVFLHEIKIAKSTVIRSEILQNLQATRTLSIVLLSISCGCVRKVIHAQKVQSSSSSNPKFSVLKSDWLNWINPKRHSRILIKVYKAITSTLQQVVSSWGVVYLKPLGH